MRPPGRGIRRALWRFLPPGYRIRRPSFPSSSRPPRTAHLAPPSVRLARRSEPCHEEVLDSEHEAGHVPVPAVREHEAVVATPVAGWGWPGLFGSELELAPVG